MPDRPAPVLECQDCGAILRYLTPPSEAQQMADKPHNFIAFCNSCAEMNARMARFHDYED